LSSRFTEKQISQIAEQATISFLEDFVLKGIDVPEVQYNYGSSSVEFDQDFRLDCSFVNNLRIQESEIVVHDLSTNARTVYERPKIVNYE